MATEYSGLQLFTKSNSVLSYTGCFWVAAKVNDYFEAFFYSITANSILCEDLSVNSDVKWNITCNLTNGIVYTSLTLISPLQAGIWKVSIECIKNADSRRDETVSTKINVSGKTKKSF